MRESMQTNMQALMMDPQQMSMNDAQDFFVAQATEAKNKKTPTYWGPGGTGGMGSDIPSPPKLQPGSGMGMGGMGTGMDISEVIKHYGSKAKTEQFEKESKTKQKKFLDKMNRSVEMSAMNIIDAALVDTNATTMGPGLLKTELRVLTRKWNDGKAMRKYKMVSEKLKKANLEKTMKDEDEEDDDYFETGVVTKVRKRDKTSRESRRLNRNDTDRKNARRKHRTLEMNPLGVIALKKSLAPASATPESVPIGNEQARKELYEEETELELELEELKLEPESEKSDSAKNADNLFRIFDSGTYFNKLIVNKPNEYTYIATKPQKKVTFQKTSQKTSQKTFQKTEVSKMLKQHRTVFQALSSSIDTVTKVNESKRKTANKNGSSQFNKTTYDPTAYSNSSKWRSDTRAKDLNQATKEAPIRAKTLVDIIDTISDLRDDIEVLKKAKRKVILDLKKLKIENRAHPGVYSEELPETNARLLALKEAQTNTEIDEMETMLKQMIVGRRKIMQQNNFVVVGDGGCDGGDGDGGDGDGGGDGGDGEDDENERKKKAPTENDSGNLGGLDGLRERRRNSNTNNNTNNNTNANNNNTSNKGYLAKCSREITEAEMMSKLWKTTQTTSLASGASAEIQTNNDGCPLYYKLLLSLKSAEQEKQYRAIYEFLKQASTAEQTEFIIFSLDPKMTKDLEPSVYAFLKVHAHSFKSLTRFSEFESFTSPQLIQLLCCALEDLHIDYLSPICSLIWIFSKIKTNRAIFIKHGVVNTAMKRLKFKQTIMKKRLLKGVGKTMKTEQQHHVCLTMLAGLFFPSAEEGL